MVHLKKISLISVICVLFGLGAEQLPQQLQIRNEKSKMKQWPFHLLILIIILLASWLRLWRLPEAPPGFWFDESYNAMDTLWMLETHSPQLFFVGNNGREPMLHYLALAPLTILGASPFTMRLVAALIGIITIPLAYRWTLLLLKTNPDRYWLAITTAAGISGSFWHVLVSRSGFRAILLPFFVILTAYLFWYGWQRQSLPYLALSGLTLGLSQYTYLPARLLPLLFLLFALLRSSLNLRLTISDFRLWQPPKTANQYLWSGLGLMALISIIVYLPLALFHWYNPAAFFARTNQTFIWSEITAGKLTLTEHLLTALSAFAVGRDVEWEFGLLGQTSFGWLNIGLFWLGLIIALKHARRANYLFLLLCLLVLWLPALFSNKPINSLRLLGFISIYHIIGAIGLLFLANALSKQFNWPAYPIKLLLFTLFLTYNLGFTTYNYFIYWTNRPEVYKEYNAPLVDLTRYLIEESAQTDFLLPFTIYAHPSARLLLHDHFQETEMPSTPPASNRPLTFVDPKAALHIDLHLVRSSSYVWLTRSPDGAGIAYVSRQEPPPNFSLKPLSESYPFINPHTKDATAFLTDLESIKPALPLFTHWPELHPVNYNLNNQFQLLDYRISPNPALPDQNINIYLYGQLLTNGPYKEYYLQLQLFDQQDILVKQTKISTRELFRWRRAGAVVQADRTIEFDSTPEPGPYRVELSLLHRNKALPLYTAAGKMLGQQITLDTIHISKE